MIRLQLAPTLIIIKRLIFRLVKSHKYIKMEIFGICCYKNDTILNYNIYIFTSCPAMNITLILENFDSEQFSHMRREIFF